MVVRSTVDWYTSVGPLVARHLAGIPLVTARYFHSNEPTYSASLHGPSPGNEPTVDVLSSAGLVQYLALHETSLLYEAHRYAIEILSWTPRPENSACVAYSRIIIAPLPGRDAGWSTHVAVTVRQALRQRNRDGIVMRDRHESIAIWVPFADGPAYDVVRAWAHVLATDVRAIDPRIDVKEVHVSSNAVGRWSLLPYSLIGPEATTAMTPLRWQELDTIPSALTCEALEKRFAEDAFHEEVVRLGEQRFDGGPILLVSGEGHGQILAAVRAVLADAKPHSAADICAEGIARGLLSPTTIPSYVQHGIATLLDRERDRGQKPEFLILPNGDYRQNVPIDPYAGFKEPQMDRSKLDALIATLKSTVVRQTPATPDDGPNIGAPFERAVAEAFAFLGLDAERLGGEGEPDVVVTAPLGSSMYRIVVECKTVATLKLHGSAAFVVEAARMRDSIGAAYAVLLGLDFPDERGINDEMKTHRVAIWTLEDLITLLECQQHHPIRWSELPQLLTAGRASDAVVEFRARHIHGPYTLAHLALQYMREEGLAYQRSLVTEGEVAPETLLTPEALTLLVNQRMAREGMVGRCATSDIRSAIAVASSELFGYIEPVGDGYAIVQQAY